MKFILFGGAEFYGRGGANDIIDVFEEIEDAVKLADFLMKQGEYKDGEGWDGEEYMARFQWFHIYSIEKDAIVVRSPVTPYGDSGSWAYRGGRDKQMGDSE